jgi:hypothetical protein
MASQAAQSKFCRPEEDPFLLLDRASRSIEQLRRRDLPLRRNWSEQPYGEEEITLLEEEMLPAIAQCLARIDAIDSALSAAGEELYRQEVWQQLRSAGFCSLGRWRSSELLQAAISAACFISFPVKCT